MGSKHAFRLYAEWLLGRSAKDEEELGRMDLRVMEYGPYFFPEGYCQTYGQVCQPFPGSQLGNDECSIVARSNGATVPFTSKNPFQKYVTPLAYSSYSYHFPYLQQLFWIRLYGRIIQKRFYSQDASMDWRKIGLFSLFTLSWIPSPKT